MNQKHIKVAVTGAAGQIGYSLLFRIAAGDMFGRDTTVDLHLLELPRAIEALKGVVMELEDCAFPLLNNIIFGSDINTVMSDVNWAVLVGAAPRKSGMERSDLLKVNGGIFTEQGRAINECAANDIKVFVVGNPCNTNCLIAMNNAPNVPRDRFFAMTMLDQHRAVAQLAMRAKVKTTGISNMIIWGNHSSTQYPDFYHAKIKDQNAVDVIDNETWLQTNFIEYVQKRGAQIINARGASSAASAANAAIDSVRCLHTGTPEDPSFSAAMCSNGEYGIDEGLIFSYPLQIKDGQAHIVTSINHPKFGLEKIRLTHDELREERDIVKQLNLIES